MSKATVKSASSINRIARKQVIAVPVAITGSGKSARINPHTMCKRLHALIAMLRVQLIETHKRCRGDVAPNELAKLLGAVIETAREMGKEAKRAETLVENERGRRPVQAVDSFADDFYAAYNACSFIIDGMSDSAIDIREGMVGYEQVRDDIKEALADLKRLDQQLKASKRQDLAKRAAY